MKRTEQQCDDFLQTMFGHYNDFKYLNTNFDLFCEMSGRSRDQVIALLNHTGTKFEIDKGKMYIKKELILVPSLDHIILYKKL